MDSIEKMLRDGASIDDILDKAQAAKKKIDAEAAKKAEAEKAAKAKAAKVASARESAVNALMLYVFALDTKLTDKEKEDMRKYLTDCLEVLEKDLEGIKSFKYSKSDSKDDDYYSWAFNNPYWKKLFYDKDTWF